MAPFSIYWGLVVNRLEEGGLEMGLCRGSRSDNEGLERALGNGDSHEVAGCLDLRWVDIALCDMSGSNRAEKGFPCLAQY